MTIENVKAYLNRGLEIHKKLEKLQFKYNNIQKCGDTDPTVRGSSHGNNTEFSFISHAHISTEIDNLSVKLERITQEIYNYIVDSGIDEKSQVVLVRRYCYCENWREISNRFNFKDIEGHGVYKMHNKAIKKICKIYK